jgi:hypothetical protein
MQHERKAAAELMVASNDLIELYQGFKNDLPTFNDDPAWVLPMPARFVIRADGIIADAEVNPDRFRSGDETVRWPARRTRSALGQGDQNTSPCRSVRCRVPALRMSMV